MAINKNSTSYTLVVATLLSLVGAAIVSIAAVQLKPIQDANAAAEKKKNILIAAGIYDETQSVDAVFDKNIVAQGIVLESGKNTDAIDVLTFNAEKAAKDPATGSVLSDDPAGIGAIAKNAVVYQLKEGEQLKRVILPIRGYGLWGTMYGFLALDADGKTIKGITFYDQKETPGLGAEITNPTWQAKWIDKKPFAVGDTPNMQLVKSINSNPDIAQHQVDALAGATLTSRGVQYTINFWLGSKGYGPYLKTLTQ